MNKLDVCKSITSVVVSVGVGSIVSHAIQSTTPSGKLGLVKTVCIGIGGFVLSCMISDEAAMYTDKAIDEVVNTVNETLAEVKAQEK